MAKELFERHAAARSLLSGVDAALGRGLLELMFQGPEEVLKDTANTQPALYAAGLAVFACLRAEGVTADAYAGHSLGEYCALQAAGVFSFLDGLKLVQARATAMAKAAAGSEGGMAAILKMDDSAVEEACRKASTAGPVCPANYNAPGQLVISGSKAGLEAAMHLCKTAGGRSIALSVSGPFHSPAMAPAGDELKRAFGGLAWSPPSALVLANVDAAPLATVEEVQAKLVEQISAPVRWTQTIQALKERGFRRYIEAGPGKVLAGLVKKIDPEALVYSVGDPASLEAAVSELKNQEG
jgi:[acyl-carrier-protein] S-malonyltransferase